MSRVPEPLVRFAVEVAEHRVQRVGVAVRILAVVRLRVDRRARQAVFEIKRGVDVVVKRVPARVVSA